MEFPSFLKNAYKSKLIEEEDWVRTNADHFDFFENIKINSDSDYINKALNCIKKHYPGLLQKTGAINKSNAKSSAIREKANSLFKKKNWIPALKNYSFSIALAENGSTELGFAYANRSALLLHRGFYKECLEDIDRALKLDYPADKKPQLITRQEKAKQLIPTQEKMIIHETVPPVPSKNKYIRGATESIELAQDDTYGRFIQATRDIAPGEIILIEDPYVLVIAQDFKTTHCGYCSNLCFNPIPCRNCSNEMFCSEKCRDNAFNEYHQYECTVLNFYPPEIFDIADIPVGDRNIANINKEQVRQLALRMTLKGFREYQTSASKETEDLYEEVGKLQTHKEKFSKSATMILAFNLAKQFQILKKHTNFMSKLHFKDKEDILKYHMLRNRLICCFSIATLQYKLDEEVNNQTNTSTGIALYTSFSYFNHACVENVGYGYYGRTLVVRAIRKIKKGEQCFINYGHFFHEHPKILRDITISRHYFFTCKCEACIKDWPLFDLKMMSKENFGFNSSAYKMLEKTRTMIDGNKKLDEETILKAFKKCGKIESLIKNEGPTMNLILLYNLVYLIVVLRYQGSDF